MTFLFKSNTMDITNGAGIAYSSGMPEFTPILVEFVLPDL
jgi:hypothetical protein